MREIIFTIDMIALILLAIVIVYDAWSRRK